MDPETFKDAWSMQMQMQDGTLLEPDLEWFDAHYSPDRPEPLATEEDDLEAVYGKGLVRTAEQMSAIHRARSEWFANDIRRLAAREVKHLRRWYDKERADLAKLYGPQTDFGSF